MSGTRSCKKGRNCQASPHERSTISLLRSQTSPPEALDRANFATDHNHLRVTGPVYTDPSVLGRMKGYLPSWVDLPSNRIIVLASH